MRDEDIRVIARAAGKMHAERRRKMMELLWDSFSEAFTNTESDDLDDNGDAYLDGCVKTDGFDRKRQSGVRGVAVRHVNCLFPLEIPPFAASFGRQIRISPFGSQRKSIRDVPMGIGSCPVTGCIRQICYNNAAPETRIRFALMQELPRVFLGHRQNPGTDRIMGSEENPLYRVEADACMPKHMYFAVEPDGRIRKLNREAVEEP